MKQKIVTGLIIVLGFILQTTVFDELSFGGVSPNILIILTSVFGFMCGNKFGMFVGFICGLLYDIFFGEVLCFYALIYMYIGYLNGCFKQIFYKEDIKLPILLIVSSDFIYGLVCYVLLFLLRGRFNILHYMGAVIIPEMVYTTLITLIIYPVLRSINEHFLKNQQRSEDNFA